MNPIESHKTWKILDSSKIQTYMQCPRRYFYEYILGWRSDTPSFDLEFGTAMHIALEHILIKGYDDTVVEEAYQLFLLHYRKFFDEEDDANRPKKNPANAFLSLAQYAIKYQRLDGDMDILYTEVAFAVLVDDDRLLYGKLDAIAKDSRGIFTVEHKTTAANNVSSWQNQWPLKTQMGSYTHALYSAFPVDEVWGVLINGLRFLKTKQDFLRVPIRKTMPAMMQWLWNVNHFMRSIENDTDILMDTCSDSNTHLKAFPMNTESCTDFWGCPYHDFCMSWNNPLRHCEEPPMGFKVERWNPLEEHNKRAKNYLAGDTIQSVAEADSQVE